MHYIYGKGVWLWGLWCIGGRGMCIRVNFVRVL